MLQLNCIKAILFDLDGTLLDLDMDSFLPQYIKALASRFIGIIDIREFGRHLLESTNKMIANKEPQVLNRQAFDDVFFDAVGQCRSSMQPIIDEFYETTFPALNSLSKRYIKSTELIKAAKGRQFQLVLATNPVFPLRAIEHRLEWAGLDPRDFELITSYENMHFCKPHIEYYEEIADILGRDPRECLMVGNDVDEDLPAGEAGMKTFLVNSAIIDRGNGRYTPDMTGSMDELIDIIKVNPE